MKISVTIDTEKANQGFVNINKASRLAVKNTLNIMASLTRKNAIKKLGENLILRNKFTQSQIQLDLIKDNRLSIANMQASTGATEKAEYLERQEFGGTRRPKHGTNLAIPSNFARGGSKKQLVSKQNYLSRISKNMVRGAFTKNFKSQKARMIACAAVGFNLNKMLHFGKSIYQITNFYKMGKSVHFVKKQIYYLGKQSTKTPSEPWLEPSTIQPSRDGQNIFNHEIDKLLKKKMI